MTVIVAVCLSASLTGGGIWYATMRWHRRFADEIEQRDHQIWELQRRLSQIQWDQWRNYTVQRMAEDNHGQ